MAKMIGDDARIRRTHQQATVDALLADAEWLLNDIFSNGGCCRFRATMPRACQSMSTKSIISRRGIKVTIPAPTWRINAL